MLVKYLFLQVNSHCLWISNFFLFLYHHSIIVMLNFSSQFLNAGVSPSLGSILYSALQVIATALGATLMDRAGRRPLLMVCNVEIFITLGLQFNWDIVILKLPLQISVAGLLMGNLSIGISFLLKVTINYKFIR